MFTGQRVAVKVIDKTKLYNRSDAKEAKEQLVQEVQCMKLVKHTNVVTLYQVRNVVIVPIPDLVPSYQTVV